MGKLIAIEGTDGSGKQTQAQMLFEYLSAEGVRCKKIGFPNYQSESSALVKMYLRGEFGKNADAVDPKIASIFFAGDRYASWKTVWEECYRESGIILTDRYVMSNLIHQAAKLDLYEERLAFKRWLEELEYSIFSLPRPDLVFYLHMDIEASFALMENRNNKFSGQADKDIHERDREYMKRSYQCAELFSRIDSWHRIECLKDGEIRTREEIHQELVRILKEERIV